MVPEYGPNSKSGDLVFLLGSPTNVMLNLLDTFTNWPIAQDCKIECSGEGVTPTLTANFSKQMEVRDRE